MKNVGMLALRTTTGALMAGHGAQKLFGWFGGYGLTGTSGWIESLNLKPGKPWAVAAGASEFGGGVLTTLGFLNPLGPLGIIGSMAMAAATAHKGKPIWVTSGGAELPLTNIAVAVAVALSDPGEYTLDKALGIRVPRWTFLPGLAATLGVVAYAATRKSEPAEPAQDAARDELQSEGELHAEVETDAASIVM